MHTDLIGERPVADLGRPRLAVVASSARALVDRRSIALFIGLFVAYGVVGRASLAFRVEPVDIAAIFPASGIAIGVLLRHGRERRGWVLLAVAPAAALAYLGAGYGPALSLSFALAHLATVAVAALTLDRMRFAGLDTLRGVRQFLVAAGLIGPSCGAVIGTVAAVAMADAQAAPTFLAWAFSDAGGILAVAPLFMVIHRSGTGAERSWPRTLEGAALGGALVGMAAVSFGPWNLAITPAAYPIFFLLVIIGVRFGVVGAALATATVSFIAVAGTYAGVGPIAALNPLPGIQVGQAEVLIGVAFLTAFVSAAAMAERRVAAEALEARIAAETARSELSGRVAAFAREISDALEAEALFQRIVQAAAEAIPADIVLLTTAVPDTDGAHRIVAAIGAPNAIGRSVNPGDGVTGTAIRQGRLVSVERVEQGARLASMRDVLPETPVAVVAAPIEIEGAIGAALSLARADLDRPFDAGEREALEMMAGISGVALRNSREFGRVQERSIRDELTGVPNRRYFTTSFDQLAAHRVRQAPEQREPISALLFDLDHFGAVNNERGHVTGDRVLAEFGGLLAARLRRADIVARYGGEEFVAILVGTGRADAVRVADEIRLAFSQRSIDGADGSPIHCTVSAGVATVGADDASLDGLLTTADVALSMAKRAGRNMVASA